MPGLLPLSDFEIQSAPFTSMNFFSLLAGTSLPWNQKVKFVVSSVMTVI